MFVEVLYDFVPQKFVGIRFSLFFANVCSIFFMFLPILGHSFLCHRPIFVFGILVISTAGHYVYFYDSIEY